MRLFDSKEVLDALAHARAGGQALHRHRFLGPRAPRCFVRDVNKGLYIGHLFDQDLERLKKTARRLGVRVVLVERQGTAYQHVDLCGQPMANATEMASALWEPEPLFEVPELDICPACEQELGSNPGCRLCDSDAASFDSST